MVCRSCGTEIADKAIICFRCGAPTLDATVARQASEATRGSRPGWLPWVVVLLALAAVVAAAVVVEDTGARVGVGAGGLVLAGGLWWGLGRYRARRGSGRVH